MDKAWRLLIGNDKFTVSSAWDKLRQRKDHNWFLQQIWTKGIWKTFSDAIGMCGLFVQVKQAVKKWWDAKCSVKLKPLYQATPAIIIWQLWTRRNTVLHGGTMSKYKWTSPSQGWFKCNSDGVSKGNPGPSSFAYCVSDSVGEFIHANARRIADTHCLVAEAKAMYNGTLNYNNFQEIPVPAKMLVNIDKMHIPLFRFKTIYTREPD
ncbi:uncharacterized protein LOC132630567 [Lycium barbarum]|uniref:uncharacterized protein LOC132630567 n=1 Tax=Lycium barbarum TaxID=112863 RepID=UPI00293F564D|nr:uncharacterized protein LOC132630567 [Lycium barbarum]